MSSLAVALLASVQDITVPPAMAETFRQIQASQPPRDYRHASDILNVQLPQFHGRSFRYALDRLGYPDKKIAIDGAIIYSWISEESNLDGGALHCTIKVIVRSAKIVNTDFFGNNGACARFATRLDPTYNPRY